MVSGDIGEPPLPPEPVPEPTAADAFEDMKANGLAAFWLTPVDGADDFDDASALRASIADDAAPKAKNMAELQQRRGGMAADKLLRIPQQAPCHREKPNKTGLSRIASGPLSTAIDARRGRFCLAGWWRLELGNQIFSGRHAANLVGSLGVGRQTT
ncbi:hypothetical protein [Bradyrhizobium valentinum]|uniref:hypothetical protein n=1 Tax=Bradyrhizobium valentinum TaxID=1518501 RepID=UPI0030B80687